jgi:tRNA A-37 threonylcarbamoyl transferase component Bud32
MRFGFESKAVNDPSGGKSSFVPPTTGQVAKLFPQLEINELLGQGGMGAVYKARQPRLNRFVALKILSPEKQDDPQFAERFAREARALAALSHPNIVAVYDFGETMGNYYLLMEFVDGLTLRHLLRARRLLATEALAIVPQICQALQYSHQRGIIHRDIKPENILLDTNGRVKIADFGIAKLLDPDLRNISLTGAQQVVGTPHYMAPEQLEKPQTVDHRADIYSLGVVFYEMLAGELPLGKFQLPSQMVQIDARLDEVVLHALEKEPERRYQTVSQVKTDVETIATTAEQKAFSIPTGGQPATGIFGGRKKAAMIGGLGLVAVVFLLCLVAFIIGKRHDLAGIPLEGLAGLWQAEGDARDSMGRHDGKLVNVVFTNGIRGRAFHLNGLNAYVQIPDSASLKPTNITVEAWVKLDAQASSHSRIPGQQTIVFKLNTRDPRRGNFEGYALIKNVNQFSFCIASPDGQQVSADSITVPQVGAWYHLAGTYDGGSGYLEIYVNGVLEGNAYAGFPLNCGARPLFIGTTGESWDNRLEGTVDEVAIYDRVLTAGEIQAYYDTVRSGNLRHGQPTPTMAATVLVSSNIFGMSERKHEPIAPPRENLVALWRGEGNGNDSAGNHAALLTNITFAEGDAGRAFVFNGSNAMIRVPANPSLDVGLSDGFTVEAWINPAHLGLQTILEWNQNNGVPHGTQQMGAHLEILEPTSDGTLFGGITDTAGINHNIRSRTGVITTNGFQHVALTYDKTSGIAALYRNGVVVAKLNLGVFTPRTSFDFFLGSRPSGFFTGMYFQGQMDEIAIYNRALAAAEIQACYDTVRRKNLRPDQAPSGASSPLSR